MLARLAAEADSTGGTGNGMMGLLRTVLTTSGPVALIATILILFLSAAVWGRLTTIEANQARILEAMASANTRMAAFSERHIQIDLERSSLMNQQLRILRQVCVNSAKTDYQTRACLAE
jgi:hypothetical protein